MGAAEEEVEDKGEVEKAEGICIVCAQARGQRQGQQEEEAAPIRC